MLKNGIKTREFWIVILGTALATVWPDFPKEGLIVLGTWVVGRTGQKAFGFVDEFDVNKWTSTEFLLSIGYAIVVAIFPDIPKESLIAVTGWTIARTGIKIGKAVKE